MTVGEKPIDAVIDVGEVAISADAAVAYAAAAGLTEPAYLDGERVCPVYLSTLTIPAQVRILDELLPPGVPPGVSVQQVMSFEGELRAPTTLRTEGRFVSAEVTERGASLSNQIVAIAPDGSFRYEQVATTILRGAEHGLASWRAGTVARLTPCEHPPARVASFDIPAGQSIRYADATGEDAPFHLSDEAARQLGFPGMFAHATNLLALYYEAVRLHASPGREVTVRRLGVSFGEPVFPPCRVDVGIGSMTTGWASGGEVGSLCFSASSGGASVVRGGVADVVASGRD